MVVALLILGAVAEVATIGAVIPFVTFLEGGRTAHHSYWPLALATANGRSSRLLATALFVVLALAAGSIRLVLAYSSRTFIFRLAHELTVEIQRRLLLQPLSFHIHRNTSTLLTALDKCEASVFSVLLPLMQAAAAVVIAASIVALMLVVAPPAIVVVGAVLMLAYALVSAIMRKRLAANSAILGAAYDARFQTVQESYGGIRDIIINNAQAMHLRAFETIDRQLASARSSTQFIAVAPQYLIETLAIVVIAAVAVPLAGRSGGIAAVLPALAALALAARRLLPLLQQVYTAWSAIQGQRSIFGQVTDLLRLPASDGRDSRATPLKPRQRITFDGVCFSYPTREKRALDQVSLAIPRGSMVALVGATGSGKSTFLDLLMGLLEPDEGQVLVDDTVLGPASQRAWHKAIAHVPQNIFLSDSTIARNIMLGVPDRAPEDWRIVECAKRAQLHEFILSLPDGYETRVGERGVRLSGGQRQRLGLARALYKDAGLLVLDEATNALDDATERAVFSALKDLRNEGRTIIIASHRHSVIHYCGLAVRLDHGRVVSYGPVDQCFR